LAAMKTAKCKELATAFVAIIKEGKLFQAFVSAGTRMKINAELQDELQTKYDAYLQNPEDPGLLLMMEELEERVEEAMCYKCADGSTEVLKALDFHNQLDESFLTFDLCRAKKGYEHCGIYMPSFYWLQMPGRWKFACAIQWAVVQEQMPQAYAEMEKSYGADKTIWPQPGCGAKFVPWARGASKVIEFLADGQWYSFVASRLPEELDDEIKKVLLTWHQACGRLTADEILNHIPEAFPKTGLSTDVPGVGKFDLVEWRAKGEPTLTQGGWIALCAVIASKEPMNLAHIISLCADLKEKSSSAASEHSC